MDRDVVIVGAGVVGAAIARELTRYELDVTLLEGGPDVGAGTSKANTALLHTGFDAKPGTLEARLVARGYELLSEYAPAARHPRGAHGRAAGGLGRAPARRVRRHRRALPRQRLRRDPRARPRRALPPRAEPRAGRAGRARGARRGADLPLHDAARVRHRGRAGGLRAAPRCDRRPPSSGCPAAASAWRPAAARSPRGGSSTRPGCAATRSTACSAASASP